MALLVMILRKMIKNKWLELSLLLGLILSVALVSSMPIYTDAILQRMLVKDLERLQENTNQYPAIHWSSVYMGEAVALEERTRLINQTDAYMESTAMPGFSLPVIHYVRERASERMRLVPVDPERVDPGVNRNAEIGAMSGLQDNVRLIDGRMPATEPVDGVYEALVVESALTNLRMVLGNEFKIDSELLEEPIIIRPVGVFTRKSLDDLYFYNTFLSNFNGTFFIDFDLFERDFTEAHKWPVRSSYWYYALEYGDIDLNSVYGFVRTHNRIENHLANRYVNYNTRAPALQTIGTYFDREKRLRTMLWSLNVPVMIMLGFYLFMVSNLITDRQKTEIAVLRSRGASRIQVLFGYVVEGLILGSIAFLVGPHVGMMLTKLLGASNGFLEFVQRSALKVRVDQEAYRYALYAVCTSMVMTLIPAFLATRTTIVGHKQQMARTQKKSFWHKFYLDIILIAVSIYGLQNFKRRMEDLLNLGLDSSDFKVDPLLFLVPALFIVGLGLLILRVYPWFVQFVYWIGKKWWPPSLYSTLIQVGRSSSQYQFLMVFLIMTISTGLFSASAARTMNQNTEDVIRYRNGADMVLQIRWENDAPPAFYFESMDDGEEGGGASVPAAPVRVQYAEPPFYPITQLAGVEHAAKVFIKNDATFTSGSQRGQVRLMGIETDEFGRTAWLRNGLLGGPGRHFYDYLNLISVDPSAVLISRAMAEQHGLRVGDQLNLGWSGIDPKSFLIYGIIDYWPGFNPNPQAAPGSRTATRAPLLVVGHLGYIQNNLALEPYEVWVNLKEDASLQQFYDSIAESGIPVTRYTDTRGEIIDARNDPFQLAINGVMTLGFIISVVISFFGFLLYWILSLQGRILQLGILRAMGISFSQLIGMLVTEQLLTSGAAIFIGILTGSVTSYLFVPMFQISFNPATQVPPFQVTFDPNDSLQLYMIVSVMIGIGLIILSYLLSRIKIHQAVKLGED